MTEKCPFWNEYDSMAGHILTVRLTPIFWRPSAAPGKNGLSA